jgi:hypothetical protein
MKRPSHVPTGGLWQHRFDRRFDQAPGGMTTTPASCHSAACTSQPRLRLPVATLVHPRLAGRTRLSTLSSCCTGVCCDRMHGHAWGLISSWLVSRPPPSPPTQNSAARPTAWEPHFGLAICCASMLQLCCGGPGYLMGLMALTAPAAWGWYQQLAADSCKLLDAVPCQPGAIVLCPASSHARLHGPCHGHITRTGCHKRIAEALTELAIQHARW